MKRHSMQTKSVRRVESHARNEAGEVVRLSRDEQVSVNDLYTTGVKKDSRVFHRGARIA